MGTVALAVHEAQDEQGHACAICQTAIGPGEPVGRCPTCDAPFHGECWEENGGCASYGCPQVPSVPKADAPAEGSSYWGQEDKECPRCHQRIRLAALRCRHCGQTFESRTPGGASPAGRPAAKPTGAIAVWLFVLGLIPFTAPLVLVVGGPGLWLGRRRVRRWPAIRRAMAVVSVAAAAVVSLLVALVLALHAPGTAPAAPSDAGAEQSESGGAEQSEAGEEEELEEEEYQSEEEPPDGGEGAPAGSTGEEAR